MKDIKKWNILKKIKDIKKLRIANHADPAEASAQRRQT